MPDQTPVKCASGYTYAEKPLAFHYEGADYQVERIVQEWRQPESKRFLVQETAGQFFDLMYDTEADQWQITPRGANYD